MITETIPAPRTSPEPATDDGDVVMTWDRWSGWAHLARHRPGDTAPPAFVGLARLPGPTAADVRANLTASGLTVLTEYDVDEQLTEFRVGLTAGAR
ncbi:hypothetical protein CU254_41530 (plasmid) [Amycolatopsis sp. AA4]|uniref:hypothetical protein n=1 Tax=Actinomycetes TaxID=1760 RepID=UPI0001B556B5|nr:MULTISPECIES: hypothetical protein [Actinomycetes]ATY17069.1 hypothetical protein CU254_41530 [Amycolatopsis sp. AA4]